MNEARTIVPSGLFCSAKAFPTDVFEADVSKAFTLAFMSMNEIPVFNQFDIWQVYTDNIDITTLHDLTLYYVEVQEELFNRKLLFNKKYCLIYGSFLKKVMCGKIRICITSNLQEHINVITKKSLMNYGSMKSVAIPIWTRLSKNSLPI